MGRKRILIVDDSRIILKAFTTVLGQAGYEVIEARDGGTAVNLVRTQKPDLILLDITFPPDVEHGGGIAWDGFLIMDWLKRMGQGQGTPIVVISSGEAAKYKARALGAGAVGYLQKPIKAEALLQAVGEALGQTPAAPG